MARKRMIDPGVWDSEQVQSLTATQFKLYIYLISTADDEGRFKINFKMIASKAMPLEENYRASECKNDITEIHSDGLVQLYYDTDGNLCGHHPNWTRYQSIQKKKDSHIDPPEIGRPYRSGNDTDSEPGQGNTDIESVPDEYCTDTVPVPPNRIERNRKEKNTSARKNARAPDLDTKPEEKPDKPPSRSGPTPPAPLKDAVAAEWEAACTEVQPADTWGDFGKERRSCNTLAHRTRNMLDKSQYETPAAMISAVLEVFQRLKREAKPSDSYWSNAPCTPSTMLNRWPAIWSVLSEQEQNRVETGPRIPTKCPSCGSVLVHAEGRARCTECSNRFNLDRGTMTWIPVPVEESA